MTPEECLEKYKEKRRKEKENSRKFFLLCVGIVLGLCLGLIVHVSAAHDYYVDRPLIDVNPTNQSDYKMQQDYGYIKVMLRCGYNTLSPSFVLTNLDANVSKVYSINPDGFFKEEFKVGNYSALLPDGNGGQPEPIQYFTVAPQQTSYVSFLGHAISTGDVKDTIIIKEASYGAIERRCHEELVHAAYTEVIPEHYEYVGHNHGDYDKHGNSYRYVGHNRGDYEKIERRAIQHPAVYRTVCENYGSYVDVTNEVQAAVDNGFREMMFFDNAQNPGGLFVSTGLFRPIHDPAVGIVKDVIIEYSINGVNKEVVTKEYEKIRI